MRVPRIYTPQLLEEGSVIALEPEASNHLSRVLRLGDGAGLILFNGHGGEYEAVVETAHRGQTRVRVGRFNPCSGESPLSVTLVQGISRGERMDYAIQKAVELGVGRIAPVATARTVVRLTGERAEKRQRHWQRVAISACEQSGRDHIPEITMPTALPQWLEQGPVDGLAVLLDPTAQCTLADFERPREPRITLLIGPEGGLTGQELASAQAGGFHGVRLGPRVLRTETAAVAMLAALQTLWGDF